MIRGDKQEPYGREILDTGLKRVCNSTFLGYRQLFQSGDSNLHPAHLKKSMTTHKIKFH